MRRYLLLLAFLALLCPPLAAQQPGLDVTLVTDEADAVLAILDRIARGEQVTDMNWVGLLSSEGYVRLKQRELAMQREFEDTVFRNFVLSDVTLERAALLRETLDKWTHVNPDSAAARALLYLPAATTIRARIYPVIKPRTNSFVFETRTNPAIFLYLDPDVSDAQFDNILAHELHHIGYASACPSEATGVRAYMGAFAEGRAMLAAAGAPDVHPHTTSADSVRAVWDRDFAKTRADMARLEEFFTAVADSAFSEEAAGRQWLQFVATDDVPQGAFYTVGYLMAQTVEQQLGRDRLLASLCDPFLFMLDYNEAVQRSGMNLPVWSNAFIDRFRR
jgi:hypothetical protein